MIFNLYLQGKSVLVIVKELERLEINSPTGKAIWPKRTIDVMLSIDVASAKSKSPRKDFVRMIDDCKKNKIDVVMTKSLSRFGRDTIDTL